MPLGGPELLIILVIVLIIFGAGRLPQVFGSLGKGVREFREASEGRSDTDTPAVDGAQQAGSASHSGPEERRGNRGTTAATTSTAAPTAATPVEASAPEPGPAPRREES
jgi:sec-independent protein translocase protein TatA